MVVTRLFGRHAAVVYDRPFQLLVAANATAVLGSTLISPILDTLTGVFGVSAAEIGLMVTVMSAPGIVLLPIGGVLADRYGRKPMMVAGLGLFGLAGTAIAFTTDFRVVLGLRLLQGIGTAGTYPVIITSLGDIYEGEREVTAQGIRSTISGLSTATFPLFAGFLVVLAWQYPFLLYLSAAAAALSLYLWLDEPADSNESDDPDAIEEQWGGVGAYVRDLLGLMGNARVMAILLARGIANVSFVAFLTYNSLIVVRTLGGTPQLAGALATVFSLGFAAGAAQAGRIVDVMGGRVPLMFAANACLLVGLPAFGLAPTVAVGAVGGVVLGTGIGILFPVYRDLVTEFAPVSLRGGLVSVVEAVGRVSGTLTPAGMGLLILALESDLTTAGALRWTVAGVGAAAGAVGLLCVAIFVVSDPVDFEVEPS